MDDPFAFNPDTVDNLQDDLNSSSSSSALPEDVEPLFNIDNQDLNSFNIDNQEQKADTFGISKTEEADTFEESPDSLASLRDNMLDSNGPHDSSSTQGNKNIYNA